MGISKESGGARGNTIYASLNRSLA